MTPELTRLLPGIARCFAPWKTNVTEVNGQIQITVIKDGIPETKLFPFPSTNKDLSIPLRAWRVLLEGQP